MLEQSSATLAMGTVQKRMAAFERYLTMDASSEIGRQRVQGFRTALPKRTPIGWHDAGISVPGMRKKRRMPGPTPTVQALRKILAAGTARSLASGAIAALACFSGLEVSEILQLRWRDLTWRDDGGSPYWDVTVLRCGRQTTIFVVGEGARTLLRHGLLSGLERDAFVLQGRFEGTPLSERAFRNALKVICAQVGWGQATRSQLIDTLAAWLRDEGFDDHTIRVILGRRRAASIDRMLHRHKQLEAQTTIDSAAALRRDS